MSSLILPTTQSRRTAIRFGSGALAGLLALYVGSSAQAEESTPLEANKALVLRLFAEVINGGDTDLLTELYAPTFLNHDVSTRQAPRPAGLPLSLAEFRIAFPSVVVTVDAAVAEGDFVATHESWRDRHPPAGTHLVGRTMHLFRIASGQIVEQRSAGWAWMEPSADGLAPGAANPLMTG